MRASSLSNARVIDLLNSYFVPVYARNQDHREGGAAPKQDKDLISRIYRDALQAGLPAGTVCAYMLTPAGKPLDTAPLNRPEATDPVRMAEKLERVVRELKVAKGEPVVKARPQSPLRAASRVGSEDPTQPTLALHLTARYLRRDGNNLVRVDTSKVLGSQKGGNWGDLPSEGWILLGQGEWLKLLPAGEVKAGTTWDLDHQVAARILTHFFPPTENTDLAKNRIDEQSLQARVESIKDGVARAYLEGKLKMKHPFYHKDDGNFVNARLVGYLDFDVNKQRAPSLRLVTDNATYGADVQHAQFFGAALRTAREP